MNKAGGIGIAIVIIGAIIGVAYSMSSNTSEDNLPAVEDLNLDESISVSEEIVSEEIVSEEPEQTGTDHTIELEENMGFKSP